MKNTTKSLKRTILIDRGSRETFGHAIFDPIFFFRILSVSRVVSIIEALPDR